MRFEIKGLDSLKQHLKDAQSAFDSLEGDIATVRIDGSDPASVETAVAKVAQEIDKRIGARRNNPFVAKIGAELKNRYASLIRQRGQEANADYEHELSLQRPSPAEEGLTPMNSSNPAAPTEKDAQRYLVLKYFYEYNEQHGADELWSEHAAYGLREQGQDISHGDVVRAITYLSDKGLLRVTKRQGFISGEETIVRGLITARGIDAIERPTDFKGILSPQVINYIVQGSVNIAHRDQQVVGNDNFGVLAQGRSRVEQLPPFPGAAIRAELAGHPEAVTAVETLERELQAERPRASTITAAIETVKNVANIAEIGKAFSGWLSDPHVQHHLSSIAASSFHL